LGTPASGADVRATHSSRVSVILLTIQRPDGPVKSRIALNAYDAVYSPTVQQFVSNATQGQINLDPKNRKMLRDAYAVDYGGKRFFRADYKQTVSEGALYVAFVFTLFRGYYIGETVMSKSPENLDLAVGSLQQISFRNDEPNLRCAMSDDLNPESIAGGVHSPGPSLNRSPNSGPLPPFISQGISNSLSTRKVTPQYPDIALRGRVQGQVVIRALIDKNGDVEDVSLVSGHRALAPAALEAVKQWKYRPYLLNGQPVKIETQITIVFQLNGQNPPMAAGTH
jgi:protein TonB